MRVCLMNARMLHGVYFKNAACVRGLISASINSAKKLRNGINVAGTRAHVVPTSIILTYHPHTNISRSQSPVAACKLAVQYHFRRRAQRGCKRRDTFPRYNHVATNYFVSTCTPVYGVRNHKNSLIPEEA